MSKVKAVFWFLVVSLIVVIFLYLFFGRPWQRSLFVKPIYRLGSDEKVVALTFDDGPSPERTLPLLEVLEKHNVKASFFMVGEKIKEHPEIAKKVVETGHLVGNHSYSHPRLIFKTPGFVREEILKTDMLLKEIGSANHSYFRPPYVNKLIVLPLVLKSLGMRLVSGSFDPGLQYQIPFPGDKVANQILGSISPGEIIYLHDGRDDSVEEFVGAVETVIIELKKRGYQFVKVDYDQHPSG